MRAACVQFLVFLGVVVGSPWLSAKDLLFIRYTLTGDKELDRLGGSLAAMGDIDGDGVPDFAAGATESADGEETGRVVLYSGKDGRVIRLMRSTESKSFFGSWVANAGDIDGDGANDVLACDSYHVQIRSSRTGEVLGVVRDPSFNASLTIMAGLGDVNGDATPDIALGSPRPQNSHYGSIRLYSGKSMEVIWKQESPYRDDYFSTVLVPVGDLDADGVLDLATRRSSLPDNRGHGIVEFRRGSDGSWIRDLSLGIADDYFGAQVEVLSDVDGDGSREVAISAPGFPLRGFPGAGRVELHDLRSGRTLWTRSGMNFNRNPFGEYLPGDNFGSSCASAGDADGDGFDDLLVFSPRHGFSGLDTPWVHLLSGKSGEVLAAYDRDRRDSYFGNALSALGDLDGDGRSEFLIGSPEWSLAGDPEQVYALGRIYVVSYRPENRPFIRGDADLDLDVDLSDVFAILEHLFAGKPRPCEEAMDIDADGRLSETDAVRLAWHLFVSGHSPWPPYPDCGRFEAFKDRLPCGRSACE